MLKKAWTYITRSWDDTPYTLPIRFQWLPPIIFEGLAWLALISIIIRLAAWLIL